MIVVFEAAPNLKIKLRDDSDEALVAALKRAQELAGREFPKDGGALGENEFPAFTLYNARGEEVGGN